MKRAKSQRVAKGEVGVGGRETKTETRVAFVPRPRSEQDERQDTYTQDAPCTVCVLCAGARARTGARCPDVHTHRDFFARVHDSLVSWRPGVEIG